MYEFGKFRFDPANHLLLSGNTPVAMTPKVFELLLVLVQNGSRLTTKEELMRRVWPNSVVEEANLTVNISALRRLLGDTADGRPYIETVTKKGYRFVAPVAEAEEVAAIAASPLADRAQEAPPEPTTRSADSSLAPLKSQFFLRGMLRRVFSPAFGLLLSLVIAVGYVAYLGLSSHNLHSGPPRRLAVLPFQILRANADNEFLGFSLADAVITKLGYVSDVVVRPSYAVQKYKTEAIDIRRVASDLNVDTLLTGTIIGEGDDLRITCQLIDVATANILWKGGFDLKYENLLTVQDRVASQIIKGLELTLTPSEDARLKQGKEISPLAYEYYLRGIDLYSTSDFPMAIKMLEKSTELAPDYALTWANLGRAYTSSASFQFGGGAQYQKAHKAFDRALALQSDQIEARIYMANMFTDTGRVEQAVPLLREALKINRNNAEIHWELGYAYRFAGMLRESIAESETARLLDPSVKLNSSTLNGYLYLGDYEKFLKSLPKTNDLALISFYRGFGEYYQGHWEEAAKLFDHAMEVDRTVLQAQIGKALSLGIRHQTSDGLDILRQLETTINQRDVGDPEAAYKIAQGYAVMGDKTSALRVLERSIDSGFFPYSYLLTDPLLDSLRGEPEFSHLLSEARQRHDAFVVAFFS